MQKTFQNNNIGIAIGTYNDEENIAYEAWSEIDITDKLKLIPILFKRENHKSGKDLGYAINTKFSY